MSIEVIIKFERECGTCFGRCTWIPNDKCENCNNTGRVPTSEGHALLEFLEHQGFRPVIAQGKEQK